jgi:hypothetical protein
MRRVGRVLSDPADALRDRGLLLLSDNILPSLATIVAGEPIRGSWWGHDKSHQIFAAARRLASADDAIAIPLVNGKITFVGRRLWPALLTVGLAREPWQTRGLSAEARALLSRAEKDGALETSGQTGRDLERRLLVVSREVHTDRGAHAKIIESWRHWAKRVDIAPLDAAAAARRALEEAAAALGAAASLPWQENRRDRRPTCPV